MRFKSFSRSFTGLTFLVLLLLATFARPVLAQSSDVTPDHKGPKPPKVSFSARSSASAKSSSAMPVDSNSKR